MSTATPEIVTDAGALATILTAALRRGLPMPVCFNANGNLPGRPTLVFVHAADLDAWAEWLAAPVAAYEPDAAGTSMHVVQADWMDWPVELRAFSNVRAVA